jgi:hypothetical protein
MRRFKEKNRKYRKEQAVFFWAGEYDLENISGYDILRRPLKVKE